MKNATFQHRHYVKLAQIIADLPDDFASNDARGLVAQRFATALQGTNPAFDPLRFYSAAIGEPSNGRDR